MASTFGVGQLCAERGVNSIEKVDGGYVEVVIRTP